MELSPTEAQKVVERIVKEYGWLSDREREVTPPSALSAITNLRTALGTTTRTLVKDLYKSKARFVFELIQNAEDNHYKNAAISHAEPYIQFSLYPDKIVVENNEDGFTVANVESICKVGGSTKTRTDSLSYIGEKGIGFKSVFMVASKAYIQSGPFSFFFEHPSGSDSSGMGMISPMCYNPDKTLNHPGTKITLILPDDIDQGELEKHFFDDLPDTLLLFLKKLRRISINKYDATATLSRHTTYTCDRDDLNGRVKLTKATQTGGNPPETTLTRYFTTKRQLSNLPDDEHREYNTAEVLLAFPVDEKDVPVIMKQDIYDYFPIGTSGFPFLIQSNFVTKLPRKGVMDCRRNHAIFDGAARAFVDAVLQFCQHPTLQYQWMRFFPTASVFESFSWEITSKIKQLLSVTQILRPYNHGPLKLISELRIAPDEFKDTSGEPLFVDSLENTYIANEYQAGKDMSMLISLGLRTLELVDVMERVKQDLASFSSTLKARETPREWHSRAAKYLLESFNGECIPQLKRMKFIPLESGEFTSILEGPVSFPQSDGIPIPKDLGLRLVKSGTIEDNEWRKKLFTAVGVTEVSIQQVRKLIFGKYKSEDSRRRILLYQSVAHLQYLYLTHEFFTSSPKQASFGTLSTNGGFGMDAVGSGTATATTSSTNPFGRPLPATRSLFGSYTGSKTSPWGPKTTGSVSKDKPTFGLFGSINTTNPASPFGATASSSSIFGSTAPPLPSGSLFGDSNQSTKPASTFGGSLFDGLSSTGTRRPVSGLGFGSTATPSGSSLFGLPSSRDTPKHASIFGGATSSPFGTSFLPNPLGGSPFGTSSSTDTLKPASAFGPTTLSLLGTGSTVTSSFTLGTSSPADKAVSFGGIKSSSDPFGSISIPATQQPVTEREILKEPGTENVAFQPTIEDEPNSHTHQQDAFQSICCQQQYKLFSYEELRLADYPRGEKRRYHDLWVFDQGRILVPCTSDVYFNSEGEFGVQELLKSSPDGSYPGLSHSLLNSAYFAAVPKNTSASPAWESWLQDQLGILRQPRLSDPNDPAKLSVIFRYLVNHRPDTLLCFLKTNWASYERVLSPELTKVISNVGFPVVDGHKRKLNSTFLPVLQPRAQKFLRGEERLPFLILHPQPIAEEWRFLEKFGAHHKENLDFYLTLLSCIREKKEDAEELSDPERIFELYEVIFSKHWSSEEMSGHEERIKCYFEQNKALYIPASDRRPPMWLKSLDCLWDAPSNLAFRIPLIHIEEYSESVVLATSLPKMLKISNLNWEVLMSELKDLSELETIPDQKAILDIYQRLDEFQIDMDEETRSTIIEQFRTLKLVFVLPQAWFSLGECIWWDKFQIKDKVAINTQYGSLRHFFVDFLGVNIPDLGMLVAELKEVATSSRSVQRAKTLIWQINSMDPAAEDLTSIYESAIFPVKIGNEDARLASRETEFAIVDCEKLASVFMKPNSMGVLAVLDFSNIDEIRKLRPFLAGLNVENRYLSKNVKETTSLSGDAKGSAEHDAVLTAQLRHRAYALSRCAFHFRSSHRQDDDRSVHQMLLSADIFTTDEITTKFELTKNGIRIQATLDKGALYIEKDQNKLNIYVPATSREKELCYRRLLPSRLLAKLMRAESAITATHLDPRAVGIVADIMTCSDLIIEDILEDAGIMRAQASPRALEGNWTTFKSGRHSSMPSPSGDTTREFGVRSQFDGPPVALAASLRQNQFSAIDLLDINSSTPDYRRLLDDLINVKSRRGRFPNKGEVFDVQGLMSALPVNLSEVQPDYDCPFGDRSEDKLAYNMRVGAAGELYVFEILKQLDPPLPEFSERNWQSSIRKYVIVHEKYQDMEVWEGYENADIIYNDTTGEFTKLLIDNGYLDRNVWANAIPPKYSLEVKTTTGECDTPFFLGLKQYRQMCRMKLEDGKPSAEVYIIFRVFNLDKYNIDMRIYVDPAGMEGKELEFNLDLELNRYSVEQYF
ncbi:hypothetical protein V8E51_016744 [Hyaloscypha variabilis]